MNFLLNWKPCPTTPPNESRLLRRSQSQLHAKALGIGSMPATFPLIDPQRLGVRRRVHGNYHIFYRIEQDRVVIVQILHGAQDIGSNLIPDD